MNLKVYVILVITFLFFFGLATAAFAGGVDTNIDPLNGCFERSGYSGEEIEYEQLDWVNNRDKYRKIIDKDRFARMKQCWQGKANCVKLATVCRKDGKVVFEGFDWMLRDK